MEVPVCGTGVADAPGRFAAIAPGLSTLKQTSLTVRPVSTPPVRRMPGPNRVLMLAPTKSALRVYLPKLDACVTTFEICPNLSGLMSYNPQTGYPPPPGSLGSTGALMQYEL